MADLTTVYHPSIPDVSYEVAASQVDRWVKQGWQKSDPSNAAIRETRKASAAARKAAAKANAKAADVTPGVTNVPAPDPTVHGAE